jgi:hypothetical protein
MVMFATIQARTFRLLVFCIKNFNLKSYETIFAMVLYLCETWYLTSREEHRLRVFGSRVLRRIQMR